MTEIPDDCGMGTTSQNGDRRMGSGSHGLPAQAMSLQAPGALIK